MDECQPINLKCVDFFQYFISTLKNEIKQRAFAPPKAFLGFLPPDFFVSHWNWVGYCGFFLSFLRTLQIQGKKRLSLLGE